MKKIQIRFLVLSFLFLSVILTYGQKEGHSSRYFASDGFIIGENIHSYNNRPVYMNNTNALILTGDQPVMRLVKGEFVYGTFMLAVKREGKAMWLQQCDRIISKYKAGRMCWEISDAAVPGLVIRLETVPVTGAAGMAIKVEAQGARNGDELVWAFGGAQWKKGRNLSWNFDVMANPDLMEWGFVPEECRGNQLKTDAPYFYTSLSDSVKNEVLFRVAGKCSSTTNATKGDASAWKNVIDFEKSDARQMPVLKGTVALEKGKAVYWAFQVADSPDTFSPEAVADPATVFAEGLKKADSYPARLKIKTPDPYLDAVALASVAAIDGAWYPPVFHHGAMLWNVRFPGWRTIFGGTMYGWHDRVRDEARFYTESQVTESDKKEAKADSALLMTLQNENSRFFGVGRIMNDQKRYDMQSQFFDQLVEEYRWTADPELVKILRQSLDLHLIWMRDCFDPDGDGVYESYLNSWPTDSQWYNGGGTAEETAYACRGHLAARDMARNAGDRKSEAYHTKMLEKIRNGFFQKLWIAGKGYSGAWREQGGHERLHEDPWLYSIFLPVDAGLTSPLQSIESVYYSEWALQNDQMPSGGRQVWTSDWVPGIWSVRERWPGDNYHLALSYFQAGLPEDGWDIMKGSFMYSAFDHRVPGNLGSVQGGTDFGDCTHTFARTLVEGLFGYRPDYPNGIVRIAPQFPAGWDSASIELPDFKIAFEKKDDKISYIYDLAREATPELFLPVSCDKIRKVTVNGKPEKWDLLPGAGQTILHLKLPGITTAKVVIETGKSTAYHAPVSVEGNIGETVRLSVPDAVITGFEDPQHVFDHIRSEKNSLTARLAANKGFHTVVLNVLSGKMPQWRVFRIHVNDPAGEAKQAARFIEKIPAGASWKTIDISPQMNADITAIYQQKYLSPRPNTVSARLGTDGYSPWTFPLWKSKPPTITTSQVKEMLDQHNRLVTPQGVPFIWNAGARNVAFTSLWDNYPVKTDFPVNRKGKTVYFLVAGSTNIMQCRIANAVIRLNYSDGKTDSLELVPPVNYWNLSTIDSHATAPGQNSRTYYTSEVDKFCMPARFPETVKLGKDCTAMLLNLKMREGVELKSITLETLSQEVVVGLMGITVMESDSQNKTE